MAEIDFDPFDCEAFPGLEFFFSGSRDMLTLNAFESAHDRKVPLLSIERRGYVVRHRVPGNFSPIPPADEGRIPLEGAPNQVARPNREREERPAPRPGRFAPPAPTPEPPRTPDLPFAQTHLRLRQGQDPFMDPGEAQSTYLQANLNGAWTTIAILNPNTGRLTRATFDRYDYPRLRGAGFCISRDGAIAVSNPTERARQHGIASAEPDLEALPPPDHAVPDGPFLDRILAFRDRLTQFDAFLTANAGLHTEINRAFGRARPLPNTLGGREAWAGFFGRVSDQLDGLRAHILAEAERPQPAWICLHYKWRQRFDLWSLLGLKGNHAAVLPPQVNIEMAELPAMHSDNPEGRAGPYTARRGLPDGWNRYVWFNVATGEIAPYTATELPPEQGGGEGGWVVGAIARPEDGIALGGERPDPVLDGFLGFIETEAGDPGPAHQGRLTGDMRAEIYRAMVHDNLVPGLPEGTINTLITVRKYYLTAGERTWMEFDEDRMHFLGRETRFSWGSVPYAGHARDAAEGTIYRLLKQTRPDGTFAIATLTAALNAEITHRLEAAEEDVALDEENDDDYIDDPEPDDDF